MRSYVSGELRDVGSRFDEYLDPTCAAIVSIDLHRGHLDDDPLCPCPAPRARALVAPVNAFHACARGMGIPIIHVRSTLRAGGVDDVAGLPSAWRLTFPLHVGTIGNIDEHALEGSRWTEFVTHVADGDLIVAGKKRLSAFYPTDLDFLLRNMGVRNVLLNGCLADCCILNSAFDASNLGYKVTVARDLIAGTTADLEDSASRIMALHLGLVADSAAILDAWRSRTKPIP